MIIKTSRQLKDKISILSGADSTKAQTLIRRYLMERFLARIEASEYRNNFILKGGMLVAAMVGIESRATMDIDTSVRMLPLSLEKAEAVVSEIIGTDVGDGICFSIRKTETIMEEHDYSGVRFTLTAELDKLRDTIRIDLSTGDELTPSAIEFSYPLMFDGQELKLWSYNTETLLAEKLETVLARSVLNTRMRDFYDIHIIWTEKEQSVDLGVLRNALFKVAGKRNTLQLLNNYQDILSDIKRSSYLAESWKNYRNSNYYVGALGWEDVIETVKVIFNNIID